VARGLRARARRVVAKRHSGRYPSGERGWTKVKSDTSSNARARSLHGRAQGTRACAAALLLNARRIIAIETEIAEELIEQGFNGVFTVEPAA
jgi:hypothetical protein